MSRISESSVRAARVLGGLVMSCVLGLAVACSDSNETAPAGASPTVETAPPATPEEVAPPAEESGAAGESEEYPAPEEGGAPEEGEPSSEEGAPAPS